MKELFYKYGKTLIWIIIFLILFLYFIIYFYPSLNFLKNQQTSLKKTTTILIKYKKEIKLFKEPTYKEKQLWKKIAKKIKSSEIFLKDEKELLSFVSKNIDNLKSILEENYNDFLINIKYKNIRITQTLRNDSRLKNSFNSISNSSSLNNNTPNNNTPKSNTFVAYSQNKEINKTNKANALKINLLFISSLKQTSFVLHQIFSRFHHFNLEKILILRKGDKTFYLITLKINIKKGYPNVKK